MTRAIIDLLTELPPEAWDGAQVYRGPICMLLAIFVLAMLTVAAEMSADA